MKSPVMLDFVQRYLDAATWAFAFVPNPFPDPRPA